MSSKLPVRNFADDESPDIHELALQAEFHDGQTGGYDVLEEEAVSAQRLVVSRLLDAHVPGSMLVCSIAEDAKTTQEKRFSLSKTYTWTTGDPDELLTDLAKGRVRANLSARMGLGKSTRLPFMIANRFECRVLHLALSANALQQTSDFVAMRGIGRYQSRWSSRKKSHVTCMTYADFNSHMISPNRSDLFKSFEVIFMDEGFVETVDVMVAKRFFSVYSLPDTSIIVASATVSNDKMQGDGTADALGVFHSVSEDKSVEAIVADNRLTSEWVVDRTAVFCPNNESVQVVYDACLNASLDVKFLDDASTAQDDQEVYDWLLGDASTIRVVVMHVRYGIAYNFPIEYELVFPYETKISFTGDHANTYLVPLTDKMVDQVKSRTGRKIAGASGGIVFSSERVDIQQLDAAERITAFVKLCAGRVVPAKTDYWQPAYEVFPKGLQATVALQLLKVCLHPKIAAKYLAEDGLFANKYTRALTIFTQPDHFLIPSDCELPESQNFWVDQQLIGSTTSIRVPIIAEGELRVIIQSIEAISQDLIDVPRWRPARDAFKRHDGYDSDEAVSQVKDIKRLRRVAEKPLPPPPEKEVDALTWSYVRSRPADNRHGVQLDRDRIIEAMGRWNDMVGDYSIPATSDIVVQSVIRETFESAREGIVESPGGSRIFTLPIDICNKLNSGDVLKPNEFLTLIEIVRTDSAKFASSKVFDMFSNPWDSFLSTLLDRSVVNQVCKMGFGTDTYAIVDCLRARHATEVASVVASSNIFRSAYKSIFRRAPTIDKIMSKIKHGSFDSIAQTSRFIDRVKHLKEVIDNVLVFAENFGMYLPNYITSAQRGLPIRGENLLGYAGDNLAPMPRFVSNAVNNPNHSRSPSGKSSLLGG